MNDLYHSFAMKRFDDVVQEETVVRIGRETKTNDRPDFISYFNSIFVGLMNAFANRFHHIRTLFVLRYKNR